MPHPIAPRPAPRFHQTVAQRPSQPPTHPVKLLLILLFSAPLLWAPAEPEPMPLTIDKIGGSGHNAP